MTAYTPAQAAAVSCLDKTLQIIACAGSGKTQVISQRIASLLALLALVTLVVKVALEWRYADQIAASRRH